MAEIKNIDYKKRGSELNDLLYQLSFINDYISLISFSFGRKTDKESLIGLHGALFYDHSFSDMSEVLRTAMEKLDDIAYELLNEQEDDQ